VILGSILCKILHEQLGKSMYLVNLCLVNNSFIVVLPYIDCHLDDRVILSLKNCPHLDCGSAQKSLFLS
jgi:hypothetical protein